MAGKCDIEIVAEAAKLNGPISKTKGSALPPYKQDSRLGGRCMDITPTEIIRSKHWNPQVEDAYRFNLAGYRDELEYKLVRNTSEVERWPTTGFVKKLQRRDGCFYYYDRARECPDKEVEKTKMYGYGGKKK